MVGALVRIPTFVYCADGKYYENLVYQDDPARREWFVCFDAKEPAEIVLRETVYKGGVTPLEILKRRGFGGALKGLINGRKDPHSRFFGAPESDTVGPFECYTALSWFLVLKKWAPLPVPNKYDSCTEVYSFFPNKEGAYFGTVR